MNQSLTYQGDVIASVTAVKLSGKPGLGVSLLVVRVEGITQPSQGQRAPRIFALGGHVIAVAPLALQNVHWQCVNRIAQSQSAELQAFLSNAQIRALDEARDAKGDFELNIVIDALVDGSQGVIPSSPITMPKKVTSSEWSQILAEMKFEDRATFEVPVSGGRVGPPLDKAAVFVRAALDKVQQRDWPGALTQCREALDELQRLHVQNPAWADFADKAKRDGWGMLERLVAAQVLVRHVTHAGPHSAIGPVDEHAVRLTVTMTAALLRYYASR